MGASVLPQVALLGCFANGLCKRAVLSIKRYSHNIVCGSQPSEKDLDL